MYCREWSLAEWGSDSVLPTNFIRAIWIGFQRLSIQVHNKLCKQQILANRAGSGAAADDAIQTDVMTMTIITVVGHFVVGWVGKLRFKSIAT